ncbi:MAG: HAD family phosphatase [Pirellulaceae bacterium]|nr:HAD family phosphatase [Pirellulaceae bacterium]
MARPFLMFDMGAVLLGFSHERMASQMGGVAGISPARAWQILFGGDLNERFERGDLTPPQFLDEFCRDAGSNPNRGDLAEAANDIFWIFPQMVAMIGHLRSAGYRLGILSNTNSAHWDYVTARYSYLTTLFHVHCTSFGLRSLKPAVEIYEAAARRAGVAPTDVFYVDDRADNIAGARRAGYDAVVFTNPPALARELLRRRILANY